MVLPAPHLDDRDFQSLVDEAKRPLGSLFRARVDVTEWLGDSQYAYIPYEAPEAIRNQLRDLSRELVG